MASASFPTLCPRARTHSRPLAQIRQSPCRQQHLLPRSWLLCALGPTESASAATEQICRLRSNGARRGAPRQTRRPAFRNMKVYACDRDSRLAPSLQSVLARTRQTELSSSTPAEPEGSMLRRCVVVSTFDASSTRTADCRVAVVWERLVCMYGWMDGWVYVLLYCSVTERWRRRRRHKTETVR
ncbi:hypothetical protein PYCCODRAFT_831070 [Trametes coccinea BRFM310]|uniref:Uncharacterized protein n=1 Tax=Trametes coccinea (strain BRFM310) TaxID=1353009 RepID=A0A1Y2IEB9_TRAC3|nr:hypothetical protein PYCCODRAFT_831070 [Trametes coccinea BRFM310]